MLETIGGVQNGIAENVLVRQTVKDVEAARLAEGGRLRPKRAPQMSVGVLTSLELHVMSQTLTLAERRVSWIKAVQIWSALRAADMFAVQIKHLSYTVGVGLQIMLTRTKTSGETKPIHVLEAYLDDRATLSETGWLQHGWLEHFAQAGGEEYMVQVPTKGDVLVTEHQLNYRIWSLAARAVLQKLTVPVRNKNGLTRGQDPLFQGDSQLFWHEHSARCSMVSWLVATGHTRSDSLRFIGRWGAGTSDVYVRTARKQVCDMQVGLATTLKSQGAHAVGEKLLMADFSRWLVAGGLAQAQVASRVACLERAAEAVLSQGSVVCCSDDEARPEGGPHQDGLGGSDASDGFSTDEGNESIIPLGTFVLSQTRCVHQVGSCWRVPYIDYQVRTVLTQEDLLKQTSFCKQCKLGVLAAESDSATDAEGEDDKVGQAFDTAGSAS
eukprot:3362507-Amphidinium_carterae.1